MSPAKKKSSDPFAAAASRRKPSKQAWQPPVRARDENGFAIPEEYLAPPEYVGPEEIPPPIIPSSAGAIAFARAEENFMLAALAGTFIAGLSSIAWAAFSVTTNSTVGFAALGVGFVVGYVVRVTGRGTRPLFGTLAGILTLLGCGMGMVLAVCADVAVTGHEAGQGQLIELFLEALDTIPIVEALTRAFHPIDAFLSVIATYQAYQLGWRRPPDPAGQEPPKRLDA